MMMNKAITLLFCTVFLNSCASLKSFDVNKITGLYQGDLSCEDCRGTKTSISIKPDFSFEKTSIFFGKENNFLESQGNWKVENDSTISLNENGTQQYYRIRKNNLIILNEGKTTKSSLHKIDQTIKAEGDFSKQKEKGVHFFATGNEPFWSLEIICEKSITFTLMGEKPIFSKDILTSYKNGVTTIKSKSKKPLIEIAIYKYQCVNDMSGAITSNYVEVKINNELYKGCGMPLRNDFRISGQWNLNFIRDFTIPTNTVGKKPVLNFNIQENKAFGNFGCNSFNGSYTINNDNLSFSKMASTLMACPNMETENKFSAALQQTDSYKIVNNELQLYRGKELLLSFKR